MPTGAQTSRRFAPRRMEEAELAVGLLALDLERGDIKIKWETVVWDMLAYVFFGLRLWRSVMLGFKVKT